MTKSELTSMVWRFECAIARMIELESDQAAPEEVDVVLALLASSLSMFNRVCQTDLPPETRARIERLAEEAYAFRLSEAAVTQANRRRVSN